MANKRARGHIQPGPKKGSAARNDNTRTDRVPTQTPRILTSQAATAVGRPGFKGAVPGPVDGKQSVRVLKQRDPAKGLSQPGADKITTTDVDLVGDQNPTILSAAGVQKAFTKNQRTVRTPRKSPPVASVRPGRVTRPRGR